MSFRQIFGHFFGILYHYLAFMVTGKQKHMKIVNRLQADFERYQKENKRRA